jgi:hypothetical protein
MRWHYLPAIMPENVMDHWGLSPITWLDPVLRGTDAWYPYALISYYHWHARRFRFDPEVFLFGDSGGYSAASVGAKIDPHSVIRWQVTNCVTGPILDIPPFAIKRGSDGPGRAAALWKTVINTQRALPRYLRALDQGNPFRWLGVIHGETKQELEEWHGRVSEVYPFDQEGEGWCFKPRPANPSSVARCLAFCRDHGIRRAHFFTIGGRDCVSTLFALGRRYGLDFVTWDHTSPIKQGINRQVMMPTEDGFWWQTVDCRSRDR